MYHSVIIAYSTQITKQIQISGEDNVIITPQLSPQDDNSQLQWYNLINGDVSSDLKLNPLEHTIINANSTLQMGLGQSLYESKLQELSFEFASTENKICFGILENDAPSITLATAFINATSFQTICSDNVQLNVFAVIQGESQIGDRYHFTVDREANQVHFMNSQGNGLWSAEFRNENNTYIMFELDGPSTLVIDQIITFGQNISKGLPDEKQVVQEERSEASEPLTTQENIVYETLMHPFDNQVPDEIKAQLPEIIPSNNSETLEKSEENTDQILNNITNKSEKASVDSTDKLVSDDTNNAQIYKENGEENIAKLVVEQEEGSEVFSSAFKAPPVKKVAAKRTLPIRQMFKKFVEIRQDGKKGRSWKLRKSTF